MAHYVWIPESTLIKWKKHTSSTSEQNQEESHQSPLQKGDHPELETTAFLDDEGIEIYQSLIGTMQWAISIGRWDIQCAVMSLSSYRVQPQVGHLEHTKRV